jgi:hypothetical protein
MRWWGLGLLALSVVASDRGEAQGQIAPAPKWCAELLNTKPEPNRIVNLYDRVRAGMEPKGQFETTPAYERRTAEALSKLAAAGRVVVVAPIYAPYDADKQSFDVGKPSGEPLTGFSSLSALRVAMFKPHEHDTVTIDRRERGASEYQGQNAYGATVNITKRTVDDYGVALINLPVKGPNWLRRRFALPMPPERAAAIQGKLSAMIVGDLSRPGLIEETFRTKPTFQSPKEVIADLHYVTMTAACGAIIATETRELLHRLN